MTPQATIEAGERPINVAVGCEFSGTVRDAFIARGHHAVSYDLIATEKPGPHVVGNLLEQDLSWADLLIVHPPCTRLCNSGVRWLRERNLWAEMREAAEFFKACLALGDKFGIPVAAENQVMHGHARRIVGRRQTQTFQPWQFGDNFKKRTCLWLQGLPKLVPTSDLDGSTAKAECHEESPGPDRWMRRSRTYPGIANAMVHQWSAAILARRNAHAA